MAKKASKKTNKRLPQRRRKPSKAAKDQLTLPSGAGGQRTITTMDEFKFALGRKKQYGFNSNELGGLLKTKAVMNADHVEVIVHGTFNRAKKGNEIPNKYGVRIIKCSAVKVALDREVFEGTPEEVVKFYNYLTKVVKVNPRIRQMRLWIGKHMFSFSTSPKAQGGPAGKMSTLPSFGKTVVLTGIDWESVARHDPKHIDRMVSSLNMKQCTIVKTDPRVHCDFE